MDLPHTTRTKPMTDPYSTRNSTVTDHAFHRHRH
jgi:hypothetical protein